MTTIDLGKIVYSWKGDYDAAQAYEKFDTCRYDNGIYICTLDAAAGTNPDNAAHWSLMISGGPAVATAEEAQAGTENTKLMTPLRVNEVLGQATPAGAVMWFAMSTPPANWLKCNGATVSRTSYADLFAAIGETHGRGNGSTTFKLPDLRGEFIRGWDDGRGADRGRGFGSGQEDELKRHRHTFHNAQTAWSYEGEGWISSGRQQGSQSIRNTLMDYFGGTETRPRNVALLPCIKF